MRTYTLFIDFKNLSSIPGAAVVAKVAMVCNDMAVANSAMAGYTEQSHRSLGHIRRGARMYFARMMCGHLHEGIKAIEQVSSNVALRKTVDRCGSRATNAFTNLSACLAKGAAKRDYEKYVGLIRHKVAFHYDPGLVHSAIEDRAIWQQSKILL